MEEGMTSITTQSVVPSEGFKIECYGPDDRRVLRYFNGAVIRESQINDYFSAKEKTPEGDESALDEALERGNNENWHIAASTLCMASNIWAQKSNPVEWEEARTFQQNANNLFSKANVLMQCIQGTKTLQLMHTVTQHETNMQLVKYAIHSRNERLKQCAKKSKALAERISESMKLQLEFLNMISEIKSQFKVLINARNLVDVSTFDVDYPASFSVFVIFYDVTFQTNDNSDTKIWEAWDLHKRSAPTAIQQCLISYYENTEAGGGLMTRMTFPLAVSHFIQNNYCLSVNGACVPVYTREDGNPACNRLKRAQMCLIDRLIFTTLCQRALEHLRSQEPALVGESILYVRKVSSEELMMVHKNCQISVSYRSMEPKECGDVVWKLAVMKLRDMAIQSWKQQVYLRQLGTTDIFVEFLAYITNLISKN